MSSTTLPPAGVTVPQLVAKAGALVEAAQEFAGILAQDPALLAEVPDETLEALALQLHAARDAATASATVVTGRVDRFIGSVRGKLVAGKYASTSQFLIAEAGLSRQEARATVGRGRDLQRDYAAVADAWLAGEVPGGATCRCWTRRCGCCGWRPTRTGATRTPCSPTSARSSRSSSTPGCSGSAAT